MRMTLAALLLTVATPVLAWEAGIEGPLCTLENASDAGEVRLTYDPGGPEYAITITTPDAWPEGPIFAMLFDGPRRNTISTDRHQLSSNGTALTVTDRGFGNVLDGLQFNKTATALLGDIAVPFDLTDAAPAVAAFRACVESPSV